MQVFISYSHEDIMTKNKLVEYMGLLNRLGGITLWHDNLIKPGAQWKREIKNQLGKADAAILLISNHLLNSDFCMDEEIPELLKKQREEGMKIYPIIIDPANWELVNWLCEFNLFPKDKKNRVKPFSLMSGPRQKEFLTFFCGKVYDDLAGEAKRATGEGQQLDNAVDREQFARNLASRYYYKQTEIIKELVNSYKWLYQKGLDQPAFELVDFFDKALSDSGYKIADSNHREILELLREGFPIEPVHLEDLSSLDAASLLSTPGYAALMLGIRLTEKDHRAALTLLRKLSQERRNLSACALIAYALGQCHRKLGHIEEAIGMLNLALIRIGEWKCEYCECGPKCSTDGLIVEVYRGLGAAYRKLKNWEKAKEYFDLAKEHLTKHVSKTIRADILFSYGYFIYERAVLEKEAIGEDCYKSQLKEAMTLFKESQDLRPRWDAPLCRYYIVKQLLGDTDIPGYWMTRQCAFSGSSVESRLTDVMCGFAILVEDLGKNDRPDRGLNSQELFTELEQIFLDRLISKGARSCHAFDNNVILGSHNLDADPWLNLVNELFQESAKWDAQSLEEQRQCIKDFRRAHPMKVGSGKRK